MAVKKQNHYKILGLKKNCKQGEVRPAYIKLVKIHHPDRNNNSIESERMFEVLTEAYNTLSDPQKRAAYDLSLRTTSRQKTSTAQSNYQYTAYNQAKPTRIGVKGSLSNQWDIARQRAIYVGLGMAVLALLNLYDTPSKIVLTAASSAFIGAVSAGVYLATHHAIFYASRLAAFIGSRASVALAKSTDDQVKFRQYGHKAGGFLGYTGLMAMALYNIPYSPLVSNLKPWIETFTLS